SVREVNLTATPSGEQNRAIQSVVATEQTGLDFINGPVLRAVLFRTGSNHDRLLIVAHHLVVDAVSLGILAGELDKICAVLIDGGDHGFDDGSPAEGSIGAWAAELERLADSPVVRAEIEYWRKVDGARRLTLPIDGRGANLESTTATIKKWLTAGETAELTRIARKTGLAKFDELLIAVLADALRNWTGDSKVLIEIERHGREIAGIDLDVSRSVGWFTVAFPLLIDLSSSSGPLDAIRSVRDSLRGVPGGGAGYGLLRYVCRE